MKKREKIVQQAFLDDEERVIKRLQCVYGQALKDLTQKSNDLQKQIYRIQEKYNSVEDEKQRKLLQSQERAKVYQKRYQDALKKQVGSILDKMHKEEFKTVQPYLNECYEKSFIGNMYVLHEEGIPLIIPIDQEKVVRAVQLDSKISGGLYRRLGEDVGLLKRRITAEVSRGIATGMSYDQMARQLASRTKIGYNNAVRITRTEGHRIQQQSTMDACYAARDRGADVVKQWDAALDAATRESHQMLDGQIRELDDKFSNGLMYPGDPSGSAAEVINCRCILLQRARWKLDSKELDRLEKRASFYGLNKEQEFDDFREKYLKAVETKEEGAYSTTVKRIGTNEVNLEYIKSEAFRKKFNKITENTAINDSLRNYATAMLLHRNGTDGEDLYIMDSKGKLLLREISGNNELGVTVSAEDSEMLRKKNGVVGIHNHPTNIPPTGSDFVAAGYRKYIFGIVVTHAGRVYKYKVGNKPFLPRILDERIDKYINTPYNLGVEEAHTRALNELAKEYGVTWEELK